MPFKDPEKAKQYRQAYRQRPEVKERKNERERKYHHLRKTNPEYKRKRKNTELKCYFGITIEDYDRMLKEQNGSCAICETKPLKLCVDHCHATGKVRGLLCNDCNLGIGKLKDNIKTLQNAISYLSK